MVENILQKLQLTHFNSENGQSGSYILVKNYILAILFAIIAVFLGYILNIGFIGYLLIFTPVVLVSSWIGGWKSGITTSFVFSILIIFINIFLNVSLSFQPLILYTIVLFTFFEGLFMSYIIDSSHTSREIEEYKKRDALLTHKVEQLEQKHQKAIEEVKARDEFLSIASHELKTPLTSMLMQLQTAIHNIKNVSLANFSVEKLMNMLNNTEKQSKRLSKMINDLLNVSLITTGKLNLEPENFDLIPLAQDCVGQFSDKAEQNGYSIKFESDNNIPVFWDKLRIEQIFANLITNAMKYGNNRPIDISVHKTGNAVKIVVSDEGIGIPSEKLDLIFERFERGGVSDKYTGLGVGLYITKQIVKAHGGTIKVDSGVNEGTTFTVLIPFKKLLTESHPVQIHHAVN